MGNGIISRANNGPKFKIGDIRLTTLDKINSKWALCNGDPISDMGGGISPELAEFCSANPLDDNSWQEITFTKSYNKILYDSENDIYYGITTSSKGSGEDVGFNYGIYRLDIETASETKLIESSYLLYNHISHLTDAVYSIYKKKIILFIEQFNANAENDDKFGYYIAEFDPNNPNSTDFTNSNRWSFVEIVGNDTPNEYYDYDNEEWIYEDQYKYSIDKAYIFGGYIIVCSYSPQYAIFIYNIDNLQEICSYYFTYEVGDWEDYYGEYVRNTNITTALNISVAESKNYICIGVGYTDTYSPMSLVDSGYEESNYSNSFAILFDKANKNILSISDLIDDGNESSYTPYAAISCIDYENDKFLFSSVRQSDGTPKVHEIDASTRHAIDYRSGNNRIIFRTISLNNELYTLAFYQYDIYIKKGHYMNSIFDMQSYSLLTTISSDSIFGIRENQNQLNYEYDSFMLKDNANYYSFMGGGCLPLIEQDGMNAFIKISN